MTPPSNVTAINDAIPDPPRPQPVTQELGVSLNLPFSNRWDPNMVYGNPLELEVPLDRLITMRKRDGQVRALMRLLTLPVRASVRDMSMEPRDGGQDEADFIDAMLTTPPAGGGMTTPISMVIRQLLLGLCDGFAAFEQVYQVPEAGELAGKITLRKLGYRPPQTVFYVLDQNGGFNGFRQRASINGRALNVYVQKDDAFYYAANEEENPYYGLSYFLPAYYHWDKKVKLYYLSHLAAQFSAVPGQRGKLPPNPDPAQLARFTKALQDFGAAGAMLVPNGYDVVDAARVAQSFPFGELIQHHNEQMSKSVLAGFIDDVTKRPLVDFSAPADEMFLMALEAIMDEIASNLTNYLLPKFVAWNFGSDKYPTFHFGPIGDPAKELLKDVWNTLQTAASPKASMEFIHDVERKMADRLDLSVDYDKLQDVWDAEEEAAHQLTEAQNSNQIASAKNPAPPTPPAPTVLKPGERVVHGKPGDENPLRSVAASATLDPEVLADRRSITELAQDAYDIDLSNPHHDAKGRFATASGGGGGGGAAPSSGAKGGGGSGGGGGGHSGSSSPHSHGYVEGDPRATDPAYRARTDKLDQRISQEMAAGHDTATLNDKVDGKYGKYTAERAAQHQEIVDSFVNKPGVKSDGEAVIMGGLGGSGKTTVIKSAVGQKALGIDLSHYVVVNPDDIKEMMVAKGMVPKYKGLKPMEAAALMHEESSYVSSMVSARALAEHKNVLWDITMSSGGSAGARISRAHGHGYKVTTAFVDVPLSTSLQRASQRHVRSGRYVPLDYLASSGDRKYGTVNRRAFEHVKSQSDRWFHFDNNGAEPVLKGSG